MRQLAEVKGNLDELEGEFWQAKKNLLEKTHELLVIRTIQVLARQAIRAAEVHRVGLVGRATRLRGGVQDSGAFCGDWPLTLPCGQPFGSWPRN